MGNKIIFICTSNADRSPSLEKYFNEVSPKNEYRSAGINKYYCGIKGTHLINEDDIKWADYMVFCEDVHLKVVSERFGGNYSGSDIEFKEPINKHNKQITLNCGNYEQGCIGEDYLTKAEMVLKNIIN